MFTPRKWLLAGLQPTLQRRIARRVSNVRQRTKKAHPGLSQDMLNGPGSPASHFSAGTQPSCGSTARDSECLDLNALITRHVSLLTPLLGRGIDLVTHLAAELPAIAARTGQVLQILLNLAASARAAMPHGGCLTLSTELQPAPINRGKLAAGSKSNENWHPSGVAGNRWMPPLSLPAACLPLRSSHQFVVLKLHIKAYGFMAPVTDGLAKPLYSTARTGNNTAMRLTTIAALLRELGGHINVESNRSGSLVVISLPGAIMTPASPTPAAASTEPTSAGEYILVAKNQDDVGTLIYRLLTMNGYNVLLSSSGVEALAAVESAKQPISMLITDVMMPGMSGQQLAAALLARYPGLPILFLSVYNSSIVQDPELNASKVAFLEKPFVHHLLVHKVREMLDNRPPPAARPQP